ncbi:MAG: hypothetical protein LBL37_06435, partial [Gracilibacteraceae bacterium]|nr:hypothetical protein [Gracilibacteraceae bacterium]
METCFFQAAALVEKAILQERPKSVLEISAFGCAYGRLIADCRERMRRDEPILIDRVDLLAGAQVIPEGLYRQVTGPEILDTPHALPAYDLILITDLLESVAPADARTLIEILSNKARQQILAITPEYPYAFSDGVPARASFRAYHPAFFFGMDFSYMKLNCLPSPRQFFSIFPPPDVPVTAGNLEPAPASQRKNPLTIACVPPPWDEYGKAEAFYRTFHALALSGHKVTVLTRPQNAEGYVFPETENPLPCTVVPPWQPYAPHAAGADVIVTGRAEDVSGFAAAEKPVVLWELSDKALYGDYGAPIFSADLVRKQRAAAYRRPDHLLCASAALQQT